MALAISNPYPSNDVFGARRVALVTVTFDASYPTGGEAFNVNSVGIANPPFAVFPAPRPAGSGAGRVVQYDKTNKKLMVFQQDPNDVGSDIALTQVLDTTDLSTLVVDLLVVGS